MSSGNTVHPKNCTHGSRSVGFCGGYVPTENIHHINWLTPGRCGCNLQWVIFKLISRIDILNISWETAVSWMQHDLTDDQSTLVLVIAWCRRQQDIWANVLCRHMARVTRPQWVNVYFIGIGIILIAITDDVIRTKENITIPWAYLMMTSSNGNTFHVTGPLCGEFSGHRWILRTKASDAELWCFLWSTPE